MLTSDIEKAPVVYVSPDLAKCISAEELGLTQDDYEDEEYMDLKAIVNLSRIAYGDKIPDSVKQDESFKRVLDKSRVMNPDYRNINA